MGFWDWLAPDLPRFETVLRPVMPAFVAIGPLVLDRDNAIRVAWLNPASGAGTAARFYYAAATYQVGRTEADALWSQLSEQLASSSSFGGRGAGGSFDVYAGGPMSALIIPGAFRVSIEATSGGQVVTNVVGVANGSGTALGAAQAVQTAWKVAQGPLSQMTAYYALTGFRSIDLSSANGAIAFVGDTATGLVGTANPLATNGACALIKWNGGTRSRSSRGRMYYGPLRENQIAADGRTIETAARNSIASAFEVFRTNLANSGYPLRVLSPTLGSAFPVTASTVEAIIATQRRRIRS